jgi:hypothetical protein
MKPILPLALLGAILFAGCDTGTQASTSSETQTALQELADNIRTSPAYIPIADHPHAARRLFFMGDSCTGAEISLIRDGSYPEEALSALDLSRGLDSLTPGSSTYRWRSCRLGLATNSTGQRKTCGEGGPFQAHWHEALLQTDNIRWIYDGTASGEDTRKGISRLEYTATNSNPTAFQLVYHEIDTTPNPVAVWFNWSDYSVSESFTLFGGDRYRISGMPNDIDTLRLAGFNCYPIQDLKDGARVIGHACYSPRADSAFVIDAADRRILGNFLATHPVADSMGLIILSATRTTDSIHLDLRIQVPSAPGLSQALTRLCLGCSLPASEAEPHRILDLDPLLVEQGIRVGWSLPSVDFDSTAGFLSIERRYPDWLTQMAIPQDSLSGWSITIATTVAIPSTP